MKNAELTQESVRALFLKHDPLFAVILGDWFVDDFLACGQRKII
jgi:hypothetical protein